MIMLHDKMAFRRTWKNYFTKFIIANYLIKLTKTINIVVEQDSIVDCEYYM